MPDSQSPTNAADRPRLTEAQKKENHIRSEQKRREAIREGFDRLASIVPGLEGQGRSEAVVLGGAIRLMREKIMERQQIIADAQANGVDTTGWELDKETMEACARQMERTLAEERQEEKDAEVKKDFGFSGDDIEEDPNDAQQEQSQTQRNQDANADTLAPPIPAKAHDLDALLSSLPEKISYSTLNITSPKGFTAKLPRRELFDVRVQIMAEDDDDEEAGVGKEALAGLDTTDLRPNIYEGGYKTWECSLDLVRYLLDRGPRKDLDDLVRVDHVVEMGCGSALPSLLLFQYALRNRLGMYFTLTDYNADVLRLVTVPNLVLAWVAGLEADERAAVLSAGGHGQGEHGGEWEDEGELQICPQLLTVFKKSLEERGITITLISGSWTPVAHLLPLIPSTPEMNTFILGSETIYSPASLQAFTDAIVGLMGRVRLGKTVVAAKRVYFGVGVVWMDLGRSVRGGVCGC
ncbi:hypothetical protein CFE70_010307 [Pyrenophora teres f. teres 0-1]